MPTGELSHIINTDIYLIDQILKGRYNGGGKLLDAGCGGGRNISWFALQPNFDIYAIDTDQDAITHLLQVYPSLNTGPGKLHAGSIIAFSRYIFRPYYLQCCPSFCTQ